MAFLIPGRTKCVLCDQPIDSAIEGTKLPFVNPDELPELATCAQRFVHRNCWTSWEHAKRYAKAAFDLIVNASPQSESLYIDIKFKYEQFIIFWIEALQKYRLEDLELLVALEIAEYEYINVADFLCAAIKQTSTAQELKLKYHVWRYELLNNRFLLEIREKGQIVFQVEIPQHRYKAWSKALDALRNILG